MQFIIDIYANSYFSEYNKKYTLNRDFFHLLNTMMMEDT